MFSICTESGILVSEIRVDNDNLNIDYSLLHKHTAIIFTTAALVFIYNVFSYLNPTNNQWLFNHSFSWGNLIRFVLIDQFLIESITIGILFFLIRKYARYFNITSVKLNMGAVMLYYLKFQPVLFCAFFLFNPVTQTVRFLVNSYPQWQLSDYLSHYFYSWKLYLTYLFPVLIAGNSIITVNFLINYQGLLVLRREKLSTVLISAFDDSGALFIKQEDILWVEKIERYYYVFTSSGRYRLKQNFNQLESSLDPGSFIRVNRSVMVNLNYVKNYSYWENDKYILRLKNSKEFIMPRLRLKKFKGKLPDLTN